ncbi:hypothetical protein LguiB_024930 [Lonicera macranthoides]
MQCYSQRGGGNHFKYPLPLSADTEDKLVWNGNSSGRFTVSSCYIQILRSNGVLGSDQCDWKWLWRKKLPARIIYFLWLLRQRKILTNKACLARGIQMDDKCKSCACQEDESHIFRDCVNAKLIWHKLNPIFLENLRVLNFSEWFDKNLKCKVCNDSGNPDWSITFASTIWNIWKSRNDFQFNDVAINHDQVALKSRALSEEIHKAFLNNNDQINSTEVRLIKWNFPSIGAFKINTDGSVGQWERGSYGGLVRNNQGKWIEGFCGYIGWSTMIKAELWAIRYALKLCKERNWEGVPIESDCQTAVLLIQGEEDEENHPDRILIEDCRKLITEMNTAVSHIFREANRCADKLAKLGVNQGEREVRMLIPPENLIEDLRADMQRVHFERGM